MIDNGSLNCLAFPLHWCIRNERPLMNTNVDETADDDEINEMKRSTWSQLDS